jgi:SAM-dependent methyltransferase
MICRLCRGAGSPWHRDRMRSYFRCGACAYIFAAKASLPTDAQARTRYNQHRNDPRDPGYRAFLGRLTAPLVARLKPGDSGLDFGCGPGPAVSVLLREAGHPVVDFDPMYRPDGDALAARYDFVTCTETAEHFIDPLRDWERMFSLLKPGGLLAVMTQLSDGLDFGTWRYKDDFTHVGFYSETTLAWIARRFGARLTVLPDSVAFFET